MARQENSSTGTTRAQRTVINVNTGGTPSGSNVSEPKHAPKQPEDTASTGTPDSITELPPRPIHTKPVHFTLGQGTRATATPIAATLFARFKPNFLNEQPAEHYTYTDKQYKRRGYI